MVPKINIINSNGHRIITQQINKNRYFFIIFYTFAQKIHKNKCKEKRDTGNMAKQKNTNRITHNLLILGDKYIIF
jgi:nitrous oxidase accessory protein NosD